MPSRKAVNELLSTHKTKRSPKKRSPISVLTDLPIKKKSSRKDRKSMKSPQKASKDKKKKKVSSKKSRPVAEVPTEAPFMDQTEKMPEMSDMSGMSGMSEEAAMNSGELASGILKTEESTKDSDGESFSGFSTEQDGFSTEEDTQVLGISLFEALVLGIGEPDALTKDELLQFFAIIGTDDVDYNSKNEDDLRFMARQYLLTVTPDVITANAIKMSKSNTEIADRYFDVIQTKIEEYQAELQNAKGIVQTAIEKFDNMANNSQLEVAERETFQNCLKELTKFQQELEKNGFLASSPPPSPKKYTALKIAGAIGAVGAVGAAALAGRIAWDARLREKILGTPLIEMKAGNGFSNMVWNKYASFFNNKKSLVDGNEEDIFKELDLEIDGEQITEPIDAEGTNAKLFLRGIPAAISEVMNTVLDKIEALDALRWMYPAQVKKLDEEIKAHECERILFELFKEIKTKFFQLMVTYSKPDLVQLIKTKAKEKYIGQAALIIWFLEIPPNMAPLVETFGRSITDKNKEELADKLAAECMKAVPKLMIINWLYNCPFFTKTDIKSLTRKNTLLQKDYGSEWVKKLIKKLTDTMTTINQNRKEIELEEIEPRELEKMEQTVSGPIEKVQADPNGLVEEVQTDPNGPVEVEEKKFTVYPE